MKQVVILTIILVSGLAISGCAPQRYTTYNHTRASGVDTLRLMTKDDVIALAKAGVHDDVIINQIEATGSYFELGTQDIVELAKAGVSDKVIQEMIKTNETAQAGETSRRDYYYNPYWYASYPFVYPWYPSYFFGLSYGYHWPFYASRFHLPRFNSFGHRGFSGGHAYGGRRSGGRHR
jgi:hypothetical protein